MIETESGMDPNSLGIKRDGKHIGYVQWHREPKIVLDEAFGHLTFSELEQVLAAYEHARKRFEISKVPEISPQPSMCCQSPTETVHQVMSVPLLFWKPIVSEVKYRCTTCHQLCNLDRRPLMVVRSRHTGIFFIKPVGHDHGFTTMDIHEATRYIRDEATMRQFERNFPGRVEFVDYPPKET